MAEGGSYFEWDKFKCPVCLDVMKSPVTIPCGHSYCLLCISSCWNKGDHIGVYVCPQCRHKFSSRPKLSKNALLAELVDKLRLEKRVEAECAGGVEVMCDVCRGARAVKSCLVCLVSYCEQHVQAHYESPAFRSHRLVTASGQLQDTVCQTHHKLLEFYCQTDKLCICYICLFGEHKGHNVVSAETERATKKIQKQLAAAQQSSQQKIKAKEKDLKELKQTLGNYKQPVKACLSESCSVRDSLVKAVRLWQTELEKLIKAEETRYLSSAQAVVAQQEQVLTELKKRDTELQQLSQSDDHIHFLKRFEALCEPAPDFGFQSLEPAVTTVQYVQECLEKFCSVELTAFTKRAKEIEGLLFTPKTRTDFLRYACTLTFDPNTVNGNLELNQEERSVTADPSCFCPGVDKCKRAPRPYPAHPDRFDFQPQVLCREALFGGRFYWEVEGAPLVGSVAICYGTIPRKENSFLDDLENSMRSWCVQCGHGYPFMLRHGPCLLEKFTQYIEPELVPGDPESQGEPKKKIKLGLFLDFSAGILSVYAVKKESMIHIHTFRSAFTEPLYVGLKPSPTCTFKLSSLE